MVDWQVAREEIEKSYTGLCSVRQRIFETDPVTKQEVENIAYVVCDVPCRLSHQSTEVTGERYSVATKEQQVKLFVSPEMDIEPGSAVVVTQDGVKRVYQRSGEPAVYPTHREYVLEMFEGWA